MKYLRNPTLLTGIIFLAMWYAARLPLWSAHLQVDVWISWLRVSYYFEHGRTFAGMVGNEILPATLLYILLPVLLIPVGWATYQTYLPATLIINLVPLVLSWYLAKNKKAILTILLLLGPILLFRFDGVVALLLVGSFLAFTSGSYGLAGALIGLSTGMKVFPILFVPYLLLLLIQKRQYKQIIGFGLAFAITIITPVLIFLAMGGSYAQVQAALAFHSQKLISIESVCGSLITGWSLITKHVPPPLIPGNGIWSVPGPHEMFNKIWLVPIALIYLWLLAKAKIYLERFEWRVPLTLMMVFLVFSKNLNPQYVWWFLIMLTYLKMSYITWILALTVALSNQIVYPLFYTTLIDHFYRANTAYWIYYVLLLRNIAIVALAIESVKNFLNLSKKKDAK